MEKIIIGLIGNSKKDISAISSFLERHGYLKTSINNKVKDVSRFIFSKDDQKQENIIRKLRERAYKINKKFWINLLLSDITKKHNKIVIEDLEEEDVIKSIKILRINKDNLEEVLKEVKNFI